MPQMGESIAEGTIVRWIKKVGDTGRSRRAAVRDLDRQGGRRDPVARRGVLTEIKVEEGETVPVNAVVGTIGAEGEATAAAAPAPHVALPRWLRPARPRPPHRRSHKPMAAGTTSAPRRPASARQGPRRRTASATRTRSARTICAARSRRRSCAASRSDHNVDITADPRLGHRRPRHEARHPASTWTGSGIRTGIANARRPRTRPARELPDPDAGPGSGSRIPARRQRPESRSSRSR